MNQRTMLVALAVLGVALGATRISTPARVHAGEAVNNCVTTSGDNNNDTIFTNTCSEAINITIAGPKGVWAPGRLNPGANASHDNGNGPFHYFACLPPAIAYDADNQNRWPNYSSNDYVCK